MLVTNKHVVADTIKTWIRIPYVHSENGTGTRRSFDFDFSNRNGIWVDHPEDEIDLCALPLQGILELMCEYDSYARHVTLDEKLIPTQEELEKLSPFEDVIMVGYPIGLIDEAHNAPIMRKGMTATHPRYDFNGKPLFMIDCACFPGSSGSPVFLLDNGAYVEGETLMLGQRRFKFLGVMFSGPVLRATGEIDVVEIPTSQRLVSTTGVMVNLGNVIKSSKLSELGEVLWKKAEPELSDNIGE